MKGKSIGKKLETNPEPKKKNELDGKRKHISEEGKVWNTHTRMSIKVLSQVKLTEMGQ